MAVTERLYRHIVRYFQEMLCIMEGSDATCTDNTSAFHQCINICLVWTTDMNKCVLLSNQETSGDIAFRPFSLPQFGGKILSVKSIKLKKVEFGIFKHHQRCNPSTGMSGLLNGEHFSFMWPHIKFLILYCFSIQTMEPLMSAIQVASCYFCIFQRCQVVSVCERSQLQET